MKANLKLYGALVCPFVGRVRFLLEQAKVPYEYQELNLLDKEQYQEWYKALNPASKVPCLVYNGDKVVVESLVINEFISEAFFPEALPSDPYERARIRQAICYLGDNVVPVFYGLFGKLRDGKTEEVEPEFIKLQERWSAFAGSTLKTNGKPFLFGESLSLADFAAAPFLNTHEILSRTILKRDLLESKDPKIQENLSKLREYLAYVKANSEFLAANEKVRVLPEEDKDAVIKALGGPGKYNFEDYVTEFFQRSFFGKK